MLEVSSKHIVCGCIVVDGEVSQLYCHQSTGAVAYECDIDGSIMQVGEVSLTDPLEIRNTDTIGKQLLANEYSGAKGLIFRSTGKVIAIMDEYTAELRTLATVKQHCKATITIDLNQVYEGQRELSE